MAYNNIPPHIAGILRTRFIVLPTQLHGHFVPLIFIVTIIVYNTSHLFSFIAFILNISQMLLGARCYCTQVTYMLYNIVLFTLPLGLQYFVFDKHFQ